MTIEKNSELLFWSKVDKQKGYCWLWLGNKDREGYGRFFIHGKVYAAHRYSYEITKGLIPTGLEIDHLCRNHSCVNPDHLEAVTHSVNNKRGDTGLSVAIRERSKTHCPQGHPYDVENTYITPKGYRQCKTCNKNRHINKDYLYRKVRSERERNQRRINK